jgi:hypothetical protein
LLLVYGMTPSNPFPDPPQRPKDSDPSDMTDFEKNTTSEELKKDLPGPPLGTSRTPGSAETEPDSGIRNK